MFQTPPNNLSTRYRAAWPLGPNAFSLPLLAFIGLSPRLASTQPDQNKIASDEFFQAGLTEMLQGNYATGCPKLAESYRLFPRPGTLFTLADCEAGWGHPATAIRHYDSYLVMLSKMDPSEQQAQRGKGREKRAREQKEALAAQVGRVTLIAPNDAPAGRTVKLNGAVFDRQELGTAIAIDPGKHVVTVQDPDGATFEKQVVIGSGEEKRVVLELPLSPPRTDVPVVQSDAAREKPLWQRSATWTGAGLAAVGIGIGVGFLLAGNAKDAQGAEKEDSLKTRTARGTDICDSMLMTLQPWRQRECDNVQSLIGERDTLHTVSAIGFAVGGVAAAAAVTMALLPAPPSSSKTAVRVVPMFAGTSGGAGVVGTF